MVRAGANAGGRDAAGVLSSAVKSELDVSCAIRCRCLAEERRGRRVEVTRGARSSKYFAGRSSSSASLSTLVYSISLHFSSTLSGEPSCQSGGRRVQLTHHSPSRLTSSRDKAAATPHASHPATPPATSTATQLLDYQPTSSTLQLQHQLTRIDVLRSLSRLPTSQSQFHLSATCSSRPLGAACLLHNHHQASSKRARLLTRSAP